MEIEVTLSDAGFEVIGPASTVKQAMALIAQPGCDMAVFDVNLGRETSEAVARELARCATPFVTMSGYAPEQMTEVMRRAPFVSKPFKSDLLVAEIARCLPTAKQNARPRWAERL